MSADDLMTPDQAIGLRKTLGLTQTELANRLGMGLRAWQEIEGGRSPVRLVHQLALERIALSIGLERGDINAVPASVRRDALDLARLIAG